MRKMVNIDTAALKEILGPDGTDLTINGPAIATFAGAVVAAPHSCSRP